VITVQSIFQYTLISECALCYIFIPNKHDQLKVSPPHPHA